jgi:hypothetical protein
MLSQRAIGKGGVIDDKCLRIRRDKLTVRPMTSYFKE